MSLHEGQTGCKALGLSEFLFSSLFVSDFFATSSAGRLMPAFTRCDQGSDESRESGDLRAVREAHIQARVGQSRLESRVCWLELVRWSLFVPLFLACATIHLSQREFQWSLLLTTITSYRLCNPSFWEGSTAAVYTATCISASHLMDWWTFLATAVALSDAWSLKVIQVPSSQIVMQPVQVGTRLGLLKPDFCYDWKGSECGEWPKSFKVGAAKPAHSACMSHRCELQ